MWDKEIKSAKAWRGLLESLKRSKFKLSEDGHRCRFQIDFELETVGLISWCARHGSAILTLYDEGSKVGEKLTRWTRNRGFLESRDLKPLCRCRVHF